MKKPHIIKKKGNKEQSVGLGKVWTHCLSPVSPCPPPAPQPEAISNIQPSHSFDNSSKAPGLKEASCFITKPCFLFLCQAIKTVLMKQCLLRGRRPCLVRDTEVTLLKVFQFLQPPPDAQIYCTTMSCSVKLDNVLLSSALEKYISSLPSTRWLLYRCVGLRVLFCYCTVAGDN